MKKFIALISAALLAAPLYAQSYLNLLEGCDPESFAVGAASVARPAGVHAAGVNAASMSLSDKTVMSGASYSSWAPKTAGSNIIGLGAWGKVGGGFAVGLDARYVIGQRYDVMDESGIVKGQDSPKDIIADAAVSYKVTDAFSVGAAAKIVHSNLGAGISSTAFGIDLGIAYSHDSFSAALAASSLGTTLDYGSSNPVPLPAIIKAGAAYSVAGLTASVEADYLFDGAFMAGLGFEYAMNDLAFLRAGYHYGDQKKALVSFASAGLGLKFYGVEFNACYLFASEALRNTVMFGLGYSF